MIKLNGQVVTPTLFPDGTSQVWHLNENLFLFNHAVIEWEWESERELFHLAQLKYLLDKRGFDARCTLKVPYLPYARQDKVATNDTTFAFHPFAEFLNTLNFNEVVAFDTHCAELAYDRICGFTNMLPRDEIQDAWVRSGAEVICYPDKGALARYAPHIGHPHVWAEKVRDAATGVIRELTLTEENHRKILGKKVLIVDDICDGGATFAALCDVLYGRGMYECHLYISHGIFSKGIALLKNAGIRRIFTRNGEVK